METLNFLKDNINVILLILGALVLWRSGFVKEIVQSSKQLLELKTQELNNCVLEKNELKEENKLLRREAIHRAEISEEDKATIKDLKNKIRDLENK